MTTTTNTRGRTGKEFWTPEAMARCNAALAAHRAAKLVNRATTEKTVCGRCGGSGILPEFGHINGGRCFKCNGNG